MLWLLEILSLDLTEVISIERSQIAERMAAGRMKLPDKMSHVRR